jgi:hypothetical protein
LTEKDFSSLWKVFLLGVNFAAAEMYLGLPIEVKVLVWLGSFY